MTTDGDEIEDEAFLELIKSIARTPDVSALRRDINRGTELVDRFVIQRALGEGGMGKVFAAYDRQRQCEVAIKMLGVLTPHSIVALKREFRVAAELIHPNLVRLYELFCDGDEWFFAMELLDGVTLAKLLAARPGDELPLIRHVFKQLARALSELHESGTIHGDLKPSNFLIVGPEQRVVLLDFGVARPLGQRRSGDAFAGTREYGAPEQFADGELTRAADWYAFGVVLFQCLTGKLPKLPQLSADLQGAPLELAKLCLELLREDPLLRPDQAAIQAVLGAEEPRGMSPQTPPARRRFVGRSQERATLLAAYDAVRPGQPQMVLVRGDSGLGKTALVEQFVNDVAERGALVLRARCRERELTSYKAIDGLIDDLVCYLDQLQREDAAALLPEGIADLTRLFPALRTAAAVVARSSRDTLDVSDQSVVKQRAIAGFRDLIEALSRRSTLVLWIDDLQWSDLQSAALLAPLLLAPKAIGLLLVGGCRSMAGSRGNTIDALYEQVPEGLPEPLLVELSPLAPADAESLAGDLLPKDAVGRELARDIAQEANGSPLFIAELVHQATSARSALSASDSRSLTQLVRNRVASLPTDARELLETAALAGMPLTRSAARRSRGLTPNREEEVIDLLRAQHLVRTYATVQARNIDLYHDRIREIVLSSVPSETKAEHHLWLARALEAESSVKPELVATHFFAGGLPKEAGAYWVKAADAAFEALAFGHAAELYARGAQHAALDAERLGRVRIRQAEALAYDGKGASAADVYLLAAEGSAQGSAIELRRRAAEQLLLAGHLERGLSVVETVLRDLRMRHTRSGWQAIPSILAGRVRVRVRGMRFRVREASEISERTLARVDASWTIACSLGVVDFMRGADFQNDHLLLALNAGEPRRLLRALTLEISYAATSGRGSEQRTHALLKIADSLAERVDDPAAAALVRLSRGIAAYLTGRFDEAIEQCQTSVATLRRSAGTVWETVTAQRFTVASLFHLGRLRALAELVPGLVTEAEANGNLYASMGFRTTYSNAAWLVGDRVAQARAHLNAAREEWRAPGVQLPHCWMFVGETHLALYTGQTQELWHRLQSEWLRFSQAQFLRIGVLRVQLWHLRAVIATCQANLLAKAGQSSDARQLYRDARHSAAVLAKQPVSIAGPLAELALAAIESATGEQDSAVRRLTQCVEACEAEDMRLYAASARMRLGELMGGEQGALLQSRGRSAFSAEGVVDAQRFSQVLAPFPAPGASTALLAG